MAYIVGSDDFQIYLSKRMRDYIGTGNLSDAVFEKVGAGDSDIDYGNVANMVPSGKMPDATGNSGNGLENIASNSRIRSHLLSSEEGTEIFSLLMRNPNTPLGFQQYRKKSALLTYDNDPSGEYTFTKIDRSGTSAYRHLLSTLGLPITETQQEEYDSKYSVTGLSEMNADSYLIVELPKDSFQEQIVGNSITLTIPKAGGGAWTLYGRYYRNQAISEPYSKLISDPNDFSQDFGGFKTQADPFNTSIAYLFSDDIATPVFSGFTTWETAEYAIFDDTRQRPLCATGTTLYTDKCIGIAYLDKGFIAIANQEIVDGFDYSNSTFDSGFVSNWTDPLPKEALYSPSSSISFKTLKTQYIQSANHVLQISEFNRTSNPTYTDSNPSLYVTEIGIYNAKNELLVLAKPKVPIEKVPNVTEIPFSIKVFL